MGNSSAGFTLIELLIVVALIGILLAVLLPNLLGARNKAIITSAQAYARSCVNSMAKFALENPGTSLVGLSCADASVQNTVVPSYISSSIVATDAAGRNYIAYSYQINGQTENASVDLNLQ